MALSRRISATLQIIIVLQVYAYDDCDEFGLCEHVNNYPTEIARSLIEELRNKNTLFNVDGVIPRIRARFRKDREELCQFTTKLMAPKKAYDANGIRRYILNDDKDPVQEFTLVRCKTKEAKCNDKLSFIPIYKGVCVQETALREMIYIDDRNRSAFGYFPVPICCSCKLVRVNSL